MKLHENKFLFTQAIQATADQLQIPAIFVEKDYWVTYALRIIFTDQKIYDYAIFKGGTSLSKCYKIIDRFSEDIDIVVSHDKNDSDNQLTKRIKSITTLVGSVLKEIEIVSITDKKGNRRKIAYEYEKQHLGDADYGQVRDNIILEATWLGHYEPFVEQNLNSLIGEFLQKGNKQIAEENNLMPFTVKVLKPERTLCEKIMSLVRFSYSENPIEDLKLKIRHCYDLHQILAREEFYNFFQSAEFEILFLKVANDDLLSFKNNNQWLKEYPNNSLIFKDIDAIWGQLKDTYNKEFRQLVFGNLPNEQLIVKTLKTIKQRLEKIIWTIKLEPNIDFSE